MRRDHRSRRIGSGHPADQRRRFLGVRLHPWRHLASGRQGPAGGDPHHCGSGGDPPAAPAPAASIPAVPTADAPQAAEAVAGTEVVAPWLGTFYFAPKPGDPPFVHIGDRVTADTVVCIIEVMKLMNTVTAGVAGVIAAVHARDGDLVEHGQPLFTVVEAA